MGVPSDSDLDRMLRPLRHLQPGEEVMLHGEASNAAHRQAFNPNYGLVVKDQGWGEPDNDPDVWNVIVLWEDGLERLHRRVDLWVIKDVLALVEPRRS